MKKVILVGALALAAGFSYAQTITPKVGLTLSTASQPDDAIGDNKSKIGFTLGAAFNFPVTESFSIQPELSFIQKGGKSEVSYSETDPDFGTVTYLSEDKATINYLEIPVLAKYTFGEKTKFFVNAGPSLGIGLGGKLKWEETLSGGGMSFTESGDEKIKFGEPGENEEGYYIDNRIDFGVQFGAGVLIANKIQLDVRYGLGLSSLNDTEGDEDGIKNRAIQFTVGIPLSFGGK